MEEQNDTRTWEPMDVEESGHVADVMQGAVKVSPTTRNDDEANPDILEF